MTFLALAKIWAFLLIMQTKTKPNCLTLEDIWQSDFFVDFFPRFMTWHSVCKIIQIVAFHDDPFQISLKKYLETKLALLVSKQKWYSKHYDLICKKMQWLVSGAASSIQSSKKILVINNRRIFLTR